MRDEIDHQPGCGRLVQGGVCGCPTYDDPVNELDERWHADPAADYIVLARGLGRLYGARSYDERRRREQDAVYLLTLLREATKPSTSTVAGMAEITAQLRQAIINLCWAVTPYGEDEDGWITRYIVASGYMHQLVGAAQGAGIPAAFRAIDKPQQVDPNG